MIPQPINQITKADIETLVSEKRTEVKTLEYKMRLPDPTHDARQELLADSHQILVYPLNIRTAR